MASPVDVDELFSKCMTESDTEKLTARKVVTYITSPFEIHCDKFAPKDEKDEREPAFEELLSQRGKDFEDKYVHDKFPNSVTIPYTTPEDGFKLIIDSMVSGTDVLHNAPIYYLPEGVYGIADLLEKSNTESSIFGNYHYTIKEVKLAKNIQEKHLLQGAFYNYLIGKIQGVTPKTFAVINGDGEESLHEYSDYEQLLFDSIDGARKILQGGSISPTYGSCNYPWASYCDKKAVETNDISLVAGVKGKMKNKLIDNKFNTMKKIASAKIEDLTEIKGIGNNKAEKFITTAKAIQAKTHIITDKGMIDFPERKVEIFLDLEGIDSTTAADGIPQIDYLIGILVRVDSKENYIPFIAKDANEDAEKKMLLEFLKFIKKQSDYVIYHYASYEKTHLKTMMKKYEIDETAKKTVLDHLVDVHKVATDSVAFPTYGNGLKRIAAYMGFDWRHKDVSATESIVMYLDYVNNSEGSEIKLQKIIDYNEDDCIATKVVKDWLVDLNASGR